MILLITPSTSLYYYTTEIMSYGKKNIDNIHFLLYGINIKLTNVHGGNEEIG